MSILGVVRVWFFRVLLLQVAAGHCLAVGEEVLSTVGQVLALDPVEAGSRPKAVRLSGVVVTVNSAGGAMVINDGSGSVGVLVGQDLASPMAGDMVDVQGRTRTFSVSRTSFTRITATAVNVTGRGELPEPKDFTVGQVNTTARLDQWVRTDGYVFMWAYKSPYLTLRLAGKDGWTTANVHIPAPAPVPQGLQGAKVRLTGVHQGDATSFNGLLVPNVDRMEILGPGVMNPFAAPLMNAREIVPGKGGDGRRVKVKGTVLAVSEGRAIYLQAGGVGMCNLLTPPWPRNNDGTVYGDAGVTPPPRPGDEVEMVGSEGESGTDGPESWYSLRWCHVRVVGQGSLPEPRRVTLKQLNDLTKHEEWVTTEATVLGWMQNGDNLHLFVQDGTLAMYMVVRDRRGMTFPEDLHGARVRFTGMRRRVLDGGTNGFMIPGPAQMEVLKPGTSDVFAAPESSLDAVVARRVLAGERVRVKALLIGRPEPDVLYLKSGSVAVKVQLLRPWNRSTNSNAMRLRDGGLWPELSPGDELEVVGMRFDAEAAAPPRQFDLESCVVRKVSGGHAIQAVPATVSELMAGARGNELVELRARLLSVQYAPMNAHRWRTTLLLEGDGGRVPVILQTIQRPVMNPLSADDEVQVRALVDQRASPGEVQLWLTSAEEVRSLGLSQVVKTQRLRVWILVAVAGLLMAGLWIIMLRRMNSLLEQRVEERTAELEHAQGELSRALTQEKELGELKSRFVSMVSHEFRTPLGIIMSAVELLQHYDDKLPVEQRRDLQQDIFGSTKHMAGLMEQVLVLGRVEAGKLGCKPVALDLDMLMGKITDETLSATNHKCPIQWGAKNDVSGAQADENLLRHIFSNLVSNAVKYSPAGEDVVFSCERQNGDVVFTVSDKGIGIPEADRGRLFEAFHRGTNVGDIQGTGLGLVIVKRCVDLHGGTLSFESEEGQGTTFKVRLPLLVAEAE